MNIKMIALKTRDVTLPLYYPSDHSELNLPVGCELTFPNPDNLLAFKLDLTPTEVRWA